MLTYANMDRIITGGQVLNLVEKRALGVQEVWLVSPFLSGRTIADLINALSRKSTINLKVITKWEPVDLLLGYSDIDAFAQLFQKTKYKKWNVQVFIAQQLHAKVILLGKSLGIVGSMNLTKGGFATNLELGAAFEENDSKLTTLRKRIDDITRRSYELTAAAYKWKLENELPRYEARAEQLRSLRELLERERSEGLQSFVPGNDGEQAYSYFRGVLDLLEYVGNNRRSREQVLDWLDSNSTYGGGDINNARTELLQRLGLVYEGPEGISQTALGRDIAADKHPKDFAQVLFGMYPEFQRLLEELSDKPRHPEEVSKTLEYGGADYWALRLRWLVSLGYAEPLVEGGKKYYRRLRQVP